MKYRSGCSQEHEFRGAREHSPPHLDASHGDRVAWTDEKRADPATPDDVAPVRMEPDDRSVIVERVAHVWEEPAVEEHRSCSRVPNEEAAPLIAVQKAGTGRNGRERTGRVSREVGLRGRGRAGGDHEQGGDGRRGDVDGPGRDRIRAGPPEPT